MSKRVSQISLAAFAGVIFLIPAIATISGKYWPFYTFASIFGVVPLIVGPSWYRLLGALALILAAVLIFHDYHAGQEFRARFNVGYIEYPLPNKSQEPAAVGACGSAVAVRVTTRQLPCFFRRE